MFLFDCGEGTQRQMMRFGVGFGVREIFISHLHADHYLGLPGLLRTMSLQGRELELVVWGGAGTEATLRSAIELGGDRLQFPVAVRELPAGEAVRYSGFEIRAFPVEHTPGSVTRDTSTAPIAASTALPPSSASLAPASAARWDVEDTPTLPNLFLPWSPLAGDL